MKKNKTYLYQFRNSFLVSFCLLVFSGCINTKTTWEVVFLPKAKVFPAVKPIDVIACFSRQEVQKWDCLDCKMNWKLIDLKTGKSCGMGFRGFQLSKMSFDSAQRTRVSLIQVEGMEDFVLEKGEFLMIITLSVGSHLYHGSVRFKVIGQAIQPQSVEDEL
jgi:hypothetical protein